MADPDQVRRRRRVRHPAGSDTSAVTTDAADVLPQPAPEPVESDTSASERGLRGLIGGGSSQVKPTAALRARDAARPRESDLARAETHLVIVRRNWTPRD